MQKNPASINLLAKRGGSFFENFISWGLTIGRVVVIVTELIALGAFLFRFSLDQQLIDLHSKIKQEQAIVEYLKDNETTYRNLQSRLSLAAKLAKQGDTNIKILNDIIGFAPQGIVFDNLDFSGKSLKIDVEAQSINALSTFIDSLKKYPITDKVGLDQIENKSGNGVFAVTITADFK